MADLTTVRTVGDTLTPLTVQLKQRDASGVLTAVDLTGLNVKVKSSEEDGTTHFAPKDAIVLDEITGKVQYDFLAAEVDTAGTYFLWFQVLDAGEVERDTFPNDGTTFRMILVSSIADS